MRNAAFILSIPGRDFVIKAGDGAGNTSSRKMNMALNMVDAYAKRFHVLPLIGSQGLLSLTG